MASTTFYDNQTTIYAAWLNDVNNAVYNGVFVSSTITATNMTCNGTASGAGFTALINNTFSAPGAIGSATPNTGTFTTCTATTQFSGPGTGLTGTGASFTAGNATLSTNCTNAIGYSQTWQNVTSSRALSTTYTNSTGKPIQIYFTAYGSASTTTGTGFTLLLNGTLSFTDGFTTGASSCAIQIIIPAGATYYISQTSGTTYTGWTWFELR